MKVALLLNGFSNYKLLKDYDYIIGVDKGALNGIKNDVILNVAIGDFDSINECEYNHLKSLVNIEKLNQYKDFTDTFYALKYAYELSDDVTIFGGILGKRVEHLIANLNMFNLYPNLKIIDDNSMIFVKDKTFEIVNSIYKYASFFSIEEVKDLSLEGFKYKLNNYDLKPFDSLCISNEITNNATVKFSDGKLLCILSHQD